MRHCLTALLGAIAALVLASTMSIAQRGRPNIIFMMAAATPISAIVEARFGSSERVAWRLAIREPPNFTKAVEALSQVGNFGTRGRFGR